MGLRTKLTLVTALLMGLVIAGGGWALYMQFRSGFLESIDEGLTARAETLAAQGEIPERGFSEPEEAFAQILSRDGEPLDSSEGLAPGPIVPRSSYGTFLRQGPSSTSSRIIEREVVVRSSTLEADKGVVSVEERFPARLAIYVIGDGPVIVVGTSLEDMNEALARLASLLWIGGSVGLVVVSGVGWLVVRGALRPVERMRAEAAAISASELSRRLPVPDHRDEIGRLGETLNQMLERLETSIDRERRFLDDAAHELRTPLANLKAELELAMRRARTPEELRGALRSANEEAERLVRLAEDLLTLSRADRGRLPIKREDSDIAELLTRTAGAFGARATELGISLEVSTPAEVWAQVDPLRFGQMVGNLLDNALRHTPSGGEVTATLSEEDGRWSIEVADSGEGFGQAFLPRVFEPLGRADEARTRSSGGTGLGLTIVRAIAEAHGGEVEARNRDGGGAMVRLTFPSEDLIPGSSSSHRPPAMLRPSEGKEQA